MDELNLYDDLDEFQEQQDKKSKELLGVEEKYEQSLKTIANLEIENKSLTKKIQRIELSFQSLLDTARAELKRKDKEIERLRKEKDDICFRRRIPHQRVNDTETQQFTEKSAQQQHFVKNPFRSDTAPETVIVASTFDKTEKDNVKETRDETLRAEDSQKHFIDSHKRNRSRDDDRHDHSKKHKNNDYNENHQKTRKPYKNECDSRNTDRLTESERCRKELTNRRDLSRNRLIRDHSPNRKNHEKKSLKALDSTERNRNRFDRAHSRDGNLRRSDQSRDSKKSSKSSESPERNSKRMERGRSRDRQISDHHHHKGWTRHKSHDRKSNHKYSTNSSKSPERISHKHSKSRDHHDDYVNKKSEKSQRSLNQDLGCKDVTILSEINADKEEISQKPIDELQSFKENEVILKKMANTNEDNDIIDKSKNKEEFCEQAIAVIDDNAIESLNECDLTKSFKQQEVLDISTPNLTTQSKDGLTGKSTKSYNNDSVSANYSPDLTKSNELEDEQLLKCNKVSLENQKTAEQYEVMTSQKQLSTPRKIALFESLFGPSPSNNSSSPNATSSSSNSLLTNIMGILDSKTNIVDSPFPDRDSSKQNTCSQTLSKNEETTYDANEFDKCFIKNDDSQKNEINMTSSIDLTDHNDQIDVNDIEFVEIPGLDFHTTTEKHKTVENNLKADKSSVKRMENECKEDISIKETTIFGEHPINHNDYFIIPGLDLLSTAKESPSLDRINIESKPTKSFNNIEISLTDIASKSPFLMESNDLETSSELNSIESDLLEVVKDESTSIHTNKDEDTTTRTTFVLETNELDNFSESSGFQSNILTADDKGASLPGLELNSPPTVDNLKQFDIEKETLEKDMLTIENIKETDKETLKSLRLIASDINNVDTTRISIVGDNFNHNIEEQLSIQIAETVQQATNKTVNKNIEDLQDSLPDSISTEKLEDFGDQNLESHSTEITADNKMEDARCSLPDTILTEKLTIQDARDKNIDSNVTETADKIIGTVSNTGNKTANRQLEALQVSLPDSKLTETVDEITETANRSFEVLQRSFPDSILIEKLTIQDVRDQILDSNATEIESAVDINGTVSTINKITDRQLEALQVSLQHSKITEKLTVKDVSEQNVDSNAETADVITGAVSNTTNKTANRKLKALQVSLPDSKLTETAGEITETANRILDSNVKDTENYVDITGTVSNTTNIELEALDVSFQDSTLTTKDARDQNLDYNATETAVDIPEVVSNITNKTANRKHEALYVSLSDSKLTNTIDEITETANRKLEALQVSLPESTLTAKLTVQDVWDQKIETVDEITETDKSKLKDLQESFPDLPDTLTVKDVRDQNSDSYTTNTTANRKLEALQVSLMDQNLESHITKRNADEKSIRTVNKLEDKIHKSHSGGESNIAYKINTDVLKEIDIATSFLIKNDKSLKIVNTVEENINESHGEATKDDAINTLSENHSTDVLEENQIENKNILAITNLAVKDIKSARNDNESHEEKTKTDEARNQNNDKKSTSVVGENQVTFNSTNTEFHKQLDHLKTHSDSLPIPKRSENKQQIIEIVEIDKIAATCSKETESIMESNLEEKESTKEIDIRSKVTPIKSVGFEKQMKHSKSDAFDSSDLIPTPTQHIFNSNESECQILEAHTKDVISLTQNKIDILNTEVISIDDSPEIINNESENQKSSPDIEEELMKIHTSSESKAKYSKSSANFTTINIIDKNLSNETDIVNKDCETSKNIHSEKISDKSQVNSEPIIDSISVPTTKTATNDIENEKNIVEIDTSVITAADNSHDAMSTGEESMKETQIFENNSLNNSNQSSNMDIKKPANQEIVIAQPILDVEASPSMDSYKTYELDRQIMEIHTRKESPAETKPDEELTEHASLKETDNGEENCITIDLEVSNKTTNIESKDKLEHSQEDILSTVNLNTIPSKEATKENDHEQIPDTQTLTETNAGKSKPDNVKLLNIDESVVEVSNDISKVFDNEELEKSLIDYVKFNKECAKTTKLSQDTPNSEEFQKSLVQNVIINENSTSSEISENQANHTEHEEVVNISNDDKISSTSSKIRGDQSDFVASHLNLEMPSVDAQTSVNTTTNTELICVVEEEQQIVVDNLLTVHPSTTNIANLSRSKLNSNLDCESLKSSKLSLDLPLVIKYTSTEPLTFKDTMNPVATEDSAKLISAPLEISTIVIDERESEKIDLNINVNEKSAKETETEADSKQNSNKKSDLKALEKHDKNSKNLSLLKDQTLLNELTKKSENILKISSSKDSENIIQNGDKESTISKLETGLNRNEEITSINALLSLKVSMTGESQPNLRIIERENTIENDALNEEKVVDQQLPTCSDTNKVLAKEIKTKDKADELLRPENEEHKILNSFNERENKSIKITIPPQKEMSKIQSFIKCPNAIQDVYNVPTILPSISTNSPTPSNFSGIFSKKSLQVTGEDDITNQKHKRRFPYLITTKPREYVLLAASVLCNVDNLENATKPNKKLHWELLENKNELTEIEDDTDVDNTDEERIKVKQKEEEKQKVVTLGQEPPPRLTPYKCMESLTSDSETQSEDESRYKSLSFLNSVTNKQKPLDERRKTVDLVPITHAISYYKHIEELEQKKKCEKNLKKKVVKKQLNFLTNKVKKTKPYRQNISKNVKAKLKAGGVIRVRKVESLMDDELVKETVNKATKSLKIANRSHTKKRPQPVGELRKRGRPKKSNPEIQQPNQYKTNEIEAGIKDDYKNDYEEKRNENEDPKNDDNPMNEIISENLLHLESNKQSKMNENIKEHQLKSKDQLQREMASKISLNSKFNKSLDDQRIYQEFLSSCSKPIKERTDHHEETSSDNSEIAFSQENIKRNEDNFKNLASSSKLENVIEKKFNKENPKNIPEYIKSITKLSENQKQRPRDLNGEHIVKDAMNVTQSVSVNEDYFSDKTEVFNEQINSDINVVAALETFKIEFIQDSINSEKPVQCITKEQIKTSIIPIEVHDMDTTHHTSVIYDKEDSIDDHNISVAENSEPECNKYLQEDELPSISKQTKPAEKSNLQRQLPKIKDPKLSVLESQRFQNEKPLGQQEFKVIGDSVKVPIICEKDVQHLTEEKSKASQTDNQKSSILTKTNSKVANIHEKHVNTAAAMANNQKRIISLEEIGIKVRPFKGHLSSFRIPKVNKELEGPKHKSWKLETYSEVSNETQHSNQSNESPHQYKVRKPERKNDKEGFALKLQKDESKLSDHNKIRANKTKENEFYFKENKEEDLIPQHKEKSAKRIKEITKNCERKMNETTQHIRYIEDTPQNSQDKTQQAIYLHNNANGPHCSKNHNQADISRKEPLKICKHSKNIKKDIKSIEMKDLKISCSKVVHQDNIEETDTTEDQRKSLTNKRKLFSSEMYSFEENFDNINPDAVESSSDRNNDNFEIKEEQNVNEKLREIVQDWNNKNSNTSSTENNHPKSDSEDNICYVSQKTASLKSHRKSINLQRRILDSSSDEEIKKIPLKSSQSSQVLNQDTKILKTLKSRRKSVNLHRRILDSSCDEDYEETTKEKKSSIEIKEFPPNVDNNQREVVNFSKDGVGTNRPTVKALRIRRKSMYQEKPSSNIPQEEGEIENNLELHTQSNEQRENTKESQKPLRMHRKSMYQESHTSTVREIDNSQADNRLDKIQLDKEIIDASPKPPKPITSLKMRRKSMYQEKVSSNNQQEQIDNQHLEAQSSIDMNQLEIINSNNVKKYTNPILQTKVSANRRKSMYQEGVTVNMQEEESKKDNQVPVLQNSKDNNHLNLQNCNKEKDETSPPPKKSLKNRRKSMYQESGTLNHHQEREKANKEEHLESKITLDKNQLEISNCNKEKSESKIPALKMRRKSIYQEREAQFDEKNLDEINSNDHQKTEIDTQLNQLDNKSILDTDMNADTRDSNFNTVLDHNKITKITNCILDSNSQDNPSINQPQTIIQNEEATSIKTKSRKRRTVKVLSTSREEPPNHLQTLQIQYNINQIPIKPPLISPTLSHPIFSTEVTQQQTDMATILPPTPNKQYDDKFKEIDSKLHEIFQSPQYMVDYKTTTHLLDATNVSSIPLTFNDSKSNITIEETMVCNHKNDQMNTTNHNDSININDTSSAHNQSEIKHLLMGSSQYRFEKVSDDVVKLFISRKRKRKRTN